MKLSTAISTLAGLRLALASTPPTHLLTNPDPDFSSQRIPTSYQSAVLGRRILALTPLATLSTVFPSDPSSSSSSSSSSDDADALERRPSGLAGVPIGLMDYIADCDAKDTGNPTILAITIATSFKNVAAGSNMSISIDWTPPYPPKKRIESSSPGNFYSRIMRSWWRGEDDAAAAAAAAAQETTHTNNHHDPVPYSAANLPRFSLLGYLEPIAADAGSPAADALQSCFLESHPDARYWLPGNRIHTSEWVRLVVTQVYWIGGFGDRAYIGWIPVDEWRNVTRDEWEAVRLPGEKPGWNEWSVPMAAEFEL
ncbi:unnamed protein product [Discula destructiva]